MSKIYEPATAEVNELVAAVSAKHHDRFTEGDVRIQTIFVTADKGPALKIAGVPKSATVKATTLEQRSKGEKDVQISIDKNVWRRLSEDQQEALIDHELEHVEYRRDKKTGAITFDEISRPKVYMKQHDWDISGFESIIERHGRAALEHTAAVQFKDKWGQLIMWAEEPAHVG